MPQYEVTLNGVRTQMFTYTTVIEAKDEDEAFEKAEDLEPEQEDWDQVDFDDEVDNLIEHDGIDEIALLEGKENMYNQAKRSVSYER